MCADEKYRLGINEVDRLFLNAEAEQGYIKPGSIILIQGTPGTGKTLLAYQILHAATRMDRHGEPQRKERRLLISCEEQRESLLGYVDEFDWRSNYRGIDVDVHNLEGLDKISPRNPEQHFEKDKENLIDKIKIHMGFQTGGTPVEVAVIDGFTSLQRRIANAAQWGREEVYIRNFTYSLFDLLRNDAQGKTALYIITAEYQPGYRQETVPCEEHLADYVITLSMKETVPGLRQRRIEIKKCRHARQVLGEHSMWIASETQLQRNDELKFIKGITGTSRDQKEQDDLKPGIIVFPRKSISGEFAAIDGKARESLEKLKVGIGGLDEMLGPIGPIEALQNGDREKQFGLFEKSRTVVLGPTGTGKTYLGLSFALNAIAPDTPARQPRSLVISFDQRPDEILRFNGDMVAEIGAGFSKELKQACRDRNLTLFYSNPVNFDMDLFIDILARVLHNVPYQRVFIDSINDVERCLDHPERFTDFLVHLFSILCETTSIVTYETRSITGQVDTPETGISYIADNVIATRHVAINDRLRKSIFIIKSRGSSFSNDVRELKIETDKGVKRVLVTRDLDLYTNLLGGRPRPVEIFIKLFWENNAELTFNREIVQDFRNRYPQIRVSSFTKKHIDSTFDKYTAQAFEAPRSSVKVVSIDEHWIDRLSGKNRQGRDGDGESGLYDFAPEFPAAEREDFYYRLLQSGYSMDFNDIHGEADADLDDRKKPLYAIPNYLDMGLFCCRSDILEKYGLNPPVSWDYDPDSEDEQDRLRSLTGIWEHLCRNEGFAREKLHAFAFEMTTPETFVTTFIEFVWNFGGGPNFIGDKQDRTWNMECFTRATRFLHDMIHNNGMMPPFPCTTRDCSKAVFARHWYSTIHTMLDEHARACRSDKTLSGLEGKLALAPFPTACSFRKTENIERTLNFARDNLEKYMKLSERYARRQVPENKRKYVEFQIERLHERIQELTAYGETPDTSHVYGNSCSGAWYLGILRSSKTHELPVSLIREMVSPARSMERMHTGAGLPTRDSFYSVYGSKPIPKLSPQWTFDKLRRELMGRLRTRCVILNENFEPGGNAANIRYHQVAKILNKHLMHALANREYCLAPDAGAAARRDPQADVLYKEVTVPIYDKIERLKNGSV